MFDRILSYMVGPKSLFLDAGCGRGDHATRLLKRGYRGFGIDISATVVRRAKENCSEWAGLHFVQGPLEALPFANSSFDFVHCRGVLMHIPDWKAALRNLCRVLKPSGYILVAENNDRSIETKLVRMARAFMKPKSRITDTDGGLEFWSVVNGAPFLARAARVESITTLLRECGVLPILVLPAAFCDIGRIPLVWLRNLAIQFNRFYFIARLPARLSSGVIILGRKMGAVVPSR
jgi:SAM-dependent methyltransferase